MPDLARLHAQLEGSIVGRSLERTLELQPIDRALALASRAFIALIPLGIIASSISPTSQNRSFADGLIDRFDLNGAGADAVRRLFATPQEVRGGTTVLGLLVLAYSVLSFARLLARTYELAWRLPRAGVKGILRGLVWVAGYAAFLSFVVPLRNVFHDVDALGPAVVVVTGSLLWLWTPYVLLAGRVTWRRLVPTGVLTGVTLGVFTTASVVYLPSSVSSSAERYGLVGVAFSLLSWLIGLAVAIVVCAAVGAVAGEGRLGELRLGRGDGGAGGPASA